MGDINIITIGIGMLLAAYGFIFRSQLDRIKELEKRPLCDRQSCLIRFGKIEDKQDKLEPILTEIRETLASLKPIIDFLKKDFENRQK